MIRTVSTLGLAGILGFLQIPTVHAQSIPAEKSSLFTSFITPPREARPRVWWHWMNGNITQEGIKADLDWMERIGIGGFQNFDANLFTPEVVPDKLEFMQPDWQEAFRYTTRLAQEKGMEMAIAGSPGWSVTGGPWVPAEDGMKKYVWTEMKVEGGKTLEIPLPKPSDITGPFRDIAVSKGGIIGGYLGTPPRFYRDALVVAYRLADVAPTLTELQAKVSSSGGSFELDHLTDGKLSTASHLPPGEVGETIWIQYAFTLPQTFRAATVAGSMEAPLAEFQGGYENRKIQVSDDGIHFRDLVNLPGSNSEQHTVSFPASTAKYWRLAIETLPPAPNPLEGLLGGGGAAPAKPEGIDIGLFELHTTSRVDRFEDKAGFTVWKENTPTYLPESGQVIAASEIVNLTSMVNEQGVLRWEVPEGNWNIIRLGYSLTGRQNHPASPEATGLEVDKLNKAAVRKYIDTYLDMYAEASGGMLGEKGLEYLILDSYEAGIMNWTQGFPELFAQKRGYSLVSWVPVLTGRIIGDAASSEKFLWDFRKTIGELIVENHYDVIGEALEDRGMKRYTESHENGRIFLADGMDVKKNAAIPMSAMWMPGSLQAGTEEEVRSEGDIRESASVANIYGKPFVAAESMTSVGNAFSWHPANLKRTADMEIASGLNRFVIHTSVHQPLELKPGFSLGPFGQYFTRHETWAEMAKPWVDYLSRSSFLLQQGENVADILYLYGENQNITWLTRESLPPIPAGYEFDFVNSTALLEAIHVEGDRLLAQSGTSYRLLVLDPSASQMTLPVLKRIWELAKNGAFITGAMPRESPSLADDPEEFQRVKEGLLQSANFLYGTLEDALNQLKISPDLEIQASPTALRFRHRKTAREDIYWVNHRSKEAIQVRLSLRVSGKLPERWHPETGEREAIGYEIKNGRTYLSLAFDPWESYFIVFSDPTTQEKLEIPEKNRFLVQQLEGNWKLIFGERELVMEKLSSWSESDDPEVKYFSGTGIYRKTFYLPEGSEPGEYLLDLGEVNFLAEVFLNGTKLGIAWKTPYQLKTGNHLRAGANTLEIRVANLWVNRLIGDQQPGVTDPTTFTTLPFYKASDPLPPSGLLGPVRLLKESN